MATLLDTQIIIWIEESPARIPQRIKDKILLETGIYFSTVSVWEMAIKLKTGKLQLKQPLPVFIENFKQGYSVQLLPISLSHIYKTQHLPLHHRDPFDRLLIAQSLVEDFSVISSDEIFDSYITNRIW